MLISFSVRNFLAFREKIEWNLIASSDRNTFEADNVVEMADFGLRLLKSAVVYGANASGKSKLIYALDYMRWFVIESSRSIQSGESTGVRPFKLNPNSIEDTSEFEIQFIHHNVLYRYGFELSATRVEAEWLFMRNPKKVRNKTEIELFYRSGQEINFHSRQFGGITGELVRNEAIRENALLLSVASQFNQPRAVKVREWLVFKLRVMTGFDEDWERAFTLLRLRNPIMKQELLNFLSGVNLDISDVQEGEQPLFSLATEGSKPSEIHKRIKQWSSQEHNSVKTWHRAYDNSHELVDSVEFSLVEDESSGTQRLIVLAGPVLDVISNGSVLVMDEMDARLHPNLATKIVQLFNSKTTNPNNAQLLFNTHDTNLLTSGNFRRDQIWFTEKNRYGEATLYSLADFKTDQVRKDEDFEANYIRGKYGAVPYLGDFNALPQAAPATDDAPAHAHEE
jgi:AAA15 family ATPase/GTPase